MIIIYGTHHYGKVDSHDHQYQLTRFFHLYYIPLLPLSSMWVTGADADGYIGHETPFSLRSVFAAAIYLVEGGLACTLLAAASASLCAWSWTWRTLRDPREQLRSEIHQRAFGTRCDPLRMPGELIAALRPRIDEAWTNVADGRTPQDVARLGANTPDEAVLAYAQLRLAACAGKGKVRRHARAAAEQVLTNFGAMGPALADPYRAAAPLREPGPSE